MTSLRRPLALIAVCAISVACVYLLSSHAFAFTGLEHHATITYGAEFALAVGLDQMRAQHTELVRQATAKICEIKVGMSADDATRIERDHAALLKNAETVATAIAAEEAKLKPPALAPKAWAETFFASAGKSGVTVVALNSIVAESATLDAAKDRLIDAMAVLHNADKPGVTGPRAGVTMDGRDKFIAGVEASLMAKSPLLSKEKGAARNEFSGYRLDTIARMSLELRGERVNSNDPMQIVSQAIAPVVMAGALSTSDFVNILANVANKSMLKGYEEAAETFPLWTSKGTLPDFKTAKRVDLGLYPSLPRTVEGAEVTYSKLTDRGVDLTLLTYGSIFPITRESIINDDLGVFTKIPNRMGQASKRTIGNLVYAVLTTNAALADSVALFHATHKNLQTTSGLAVATLSAGRSLMAKQRDPDSVSQALNIVPKYIIVPYALEALAKQLVRSSADPSQANPGVANPVAGIGEVIADARLDVNSSSTWYLAGDPGLYDTIEVDYLNGVEAPTLEQREGWNINGVEFKIRMDVGVNVLDFHALQKSTA